jgi:hypothetical protein
VHQGLALDSLGTACGKDAISPPRPGGRAPLSLAADDAQLLYAPPGRLLCMIGGYGKSRRATHLMSAIRVPAQSVAVT